MTRKEFDSIIDTVGKQLGSECPDNFRVILWGKFKDSPQWELKMNILDLLIMGKKHKGFKHVNS